MPSLFQEGDQEIECHDNVLSELFISHFLVTGSNIQVGNLLELPLDGSSDIIDFLSNWVILGDWSWEHTNSVKDWTEDGWDLLNKGISGQKGVVLLGPLLDELLVLVEFLKEIHVDDIDTGKVSSLSLIGVLLIGNEADLKGWSWAVDKFD